MLSVEVRTRAVLLVGEAVEETVKERAPDGVSRHPGIGLVIKLRQLLKLDDLRGTKGDLCEVLWCCDLEGAGQPWRAQSPLRFVLGDPEGRGCPPGPANTKAPKPHERVEQGQGRGHGL